MFPWNLFPFNKDMKNMMHQMKPDDIDKYVKDMMNNIFPQNMQGMMNPQEFMKGFSPQNNPGSPSAGQQGTKLQATVFDTHDFVFVRFPIKDENWIKQLKLYYTSNQLIIEHIPEYDDKHTITLPAIVKKKGSTANFKDGTLEIKIPKNIDMQYSEIDVLEIL